MSSYSPTVSATRPALRSQVVKDPIGGLVAGGLLLGLALLVLTAGAVELSYPLWATLPAGLLGLCLLALAGAGLAFWCRNLKGRTAPFLCPFL